MIVRALAAAMALSVASASAAQAPSDHVVVLDGKLAQRDYRGLADMIFKPVDAAQARANLDWLGQRYMQGESPFIAWAYARLLVGLAEEMPPDSARQIKGTALSAMIYATSVSLVEGLQCADATARTNRMEQFRGQLAGSGLLNLDEPMRQQAAFVALALERSSWTTRRERDEAAFQCANGMAAVTAGISAGLVQERAPEAGEIGRQLGVTPPPDFIYERRDNEEWWADAERLRGHLPTLTAMLAGVESIPAAAVEQPPPGE